MIVKLDDSIVEIEPTFKIGIIHYTKIIVTSSPQMLKGRLQLFQEQLFFELDDKVVTDFDGIKEWRALWKKFGADPNRYRPSMEAMYRRIAKQNYITPMHSAVDVNNFFSMQYEIPMGIYDVAKIEGDITLTIGNKETVYNGLNGRENKLNNILTLQDDIGPFGSPFVDSVRTAVTENTTEALQVVFLRPSLGIEESKKLLHSMATMFTQIHGGEFDTSLIGYVPKK
ncbi:B3/4 domain-containing protein [Psychrobacillus psychrodurans]|uniref:B3/B4 domain-containing protein n=1 Tax=Psychrobacillus psychrodurans TaxID=126157 RepID=UPI0008EF8EE0|nr:phenylalanine--tRNA ligase beta subunit-related protein [Psychrobacillus psychrodurans]MCZ8541935.1 phenylalanine--tRNA ligase beta subunit-related protein [Psychrobacillus psychrodurans]SFN14562.1 B3/B4 domain-containing protein (DNA/RNA-binding domain of Phe-tRNA-synthetase) [Psychrobacillus psychrodurans]